MKCPHCGYGILDVEIGRHLGAKGGTAKTAAKIRASRLNGALGGRPRNKRRKAEGEVL